MSCRTVARKCRISKSVVEEIYKKYLIYDTVENLRDRRRKWFIAIQEDRHILQKCQRDTTTSGRNVAELLGLNIFA